MNRKRLAVAVLAAAALTLVACSPESGGDSVDGTTQVKIGLLAPLTGDSAADGQGMKEGLELAIDELNEAGGVAGYSFAPEIIDTQNLQSDAVAAGVQALISDSAVKAVLTSYASANNFEIDTFAQAEMPYIVAANAEQTEDIISKDPDAYPTIWSIVPSYAPLGTELPAVIEQWDDEGKLTLRDKSVFIITSDNPFSQGISNGLTDTFNERGWDIVGEETVPFGAVNDWGSILSKVRETDPDLIINTDYLPANEATFLKQFVTNPTNSIVFMQYGPSIPEFLELTKDDSTGVLYNTLGDPIRSDKYPAAQETIDHIAEALGVDTEDVNNQAVLLYEEMMLYADALKKVGDPDKKLEIGAAIGESSTETPSGVLEFDPKTHLAKFGDDFIPLQFQQIIDGERILIAPQKYATGEFQTPPWYTN
jgi:branched-chain amino acid transport system substrate-binding protein